MEAKDHLNETGLKLPALFHFLLAEDDDDDRLFFEMAIKKLYPETRLTSFENGEQLMLYLHASHQLPDVLFLDINMPRKNGSECLEEIKATESMKDLAVIIYSTAGHEDSADILYENGAHYYIRKSNMEELGKVLNHILQLIINKKLDRPKRPDFVYKHI